MQDNADAIQAGGNHYKQMYIQPWSAMEAWLTREEFIGYLRGNIIKYHARANSGKEDKQVQLDKAAHYQQKLNEFMSKGNTSNPVKHSQIYPPSILDPNQSATS